MKKGNILIFVLIIAALIAGYFVVKQVANQNPKPTPEASLTPSTQETKTYQSKDLKFSIKLPTSFQPEENLGSVTLSGANGKIYIDRSGTNYKNIEDYVNDLAIKNKTTIEKKTKLVINNKEAISGFSGTDKNYFIYADNWVYLIFTSSESLYSDLDQIAQSFRYIP